MRNLIPALICLFLAVPSSAGIFIVDDDGPADFNNVQDAIDYSNDGDTIYVFPGTYTGPGNRDIDFLGRAVTVRSVDPEDAYFVASTVIDCNGTEDDMHRGFYFHSGEDANAVLAGFTITNGYAEDGAGIKCSGSSPSIINCTISNCTSVGNGHQTYKNDGGGGINCENFSSPTISECTINGNTVYGYYAHQGFGGNGGGIRCCDSSPTIINCIISGNKAEFTGGGIFCHHGCPKILNCIVSGNKVDSFWTYYVPGEGGGLRLGFSLGTNPTINNCTITGNEVDGSGGGMYCFGGESILLTNCTISGNSATGSGGGIFDFSIGVAVRNCTINGNTAELCGGGIYRYDSGGATTISNCILWGNTAANGPELGVDNDPYQGATAMVEYSDVQGGAVGVYVGADCTLNWEAGNIDVNPCFVSPGYWAEANDPNIHVEPNDPNAIWLDGDYHLQSQAGRWDPNQKVWVNDANTSRCIDAGNPGCPLGDEPEDADNLRINMGVYGGTAEASKTPADWSLLADLTNDGTVDWADLGLQVENLLVNGSEQPGDLNRNGIVNAVDFALLADCWHLETTWHE